VSQRDSEQRVASWVKEVGITLFTPTKAAPDVVVASVESVGEVLAFLGWVKDFRPVVIVVDFPKDVSPETLLDWGGV